MTHTERAFTRSAALGLMLFLTLLYGQRPLYRLVIRTVGDHICTFTDEHGQVSDYYWVGNHSYEVAR